MTISLQGIVKDWLPVFTFLVATFAAIVSYLNYKNFGKNKVADFRTKWIDEIRQDVSEYYGLHYEVTLLNKDIKKAKYREEETNARKQRREKYVKMSALRRRILLHLKPNSDDPNEQELEHILKSTRTSSAGNVVLHRRRMVEVTRAILKTEWDRVKRELKIEQEKKWP